MRCLFFLIASTLAIAFALGIPADVAITGLEAPSLSQESPQKKATDQKVEAKEASVKKAPVWNGEPYLLSTCAASGRPIDVKGTPNTKVIAGRELKFCCGGCAAAVEKDPAKWLGKVDAAQAAAQAKIYPMTTCCVSGEPLMEKAEDGTMKFIGENVIVKNRLFLVCCKMCAESLKAEPAKYAAKLNAEVMKTQGEGYAIGQCVVKPEGKVTGDKAKSFIIGGRLIKACCASCEKEVREDPSKYTAMVDAAIEAKRAKFRGEAPK